MEPHPYHSTFFENFKYISFLGRGGFGSVYKCQHVIDSREYAIKQINLPDKDVDQAKIFREVQALAHLEHPHIVRYYHSWIEDLPKKWYVEKAREVFTHNGTVEMDDKDMKALFTPSLRIMMSFECNQTAEPVEYDCNSDSVITFGRNGQYDDEEKEDQNNGIIL